MKNILANLRALGLAKLAALGAVSIAMLLFLGFIIVRDAGSDALLYRDLDPKEAAEMIDRLDKAHITYKLEEGGQAILVPSSKVALARLTLAKDGLPSGGSVGYEIFDRNDGFAETQFQQTINETRALEGELERSVRLIRGVKNARVHLVLQHRELFSANEQAAQAGVILTMAGGQRLDPESIDAIVNLVSAAIPGLQRKNISLVDNHGRVLVRDGNNPSSDEMNPEEMRQAVEARLSRSVEDILGATFGMDRVHAEANVTIDSGHLRRTRESYDPDQQVLRSQQIKTDKSINTENANNTSVKNNLPNANAGEAATGNQSTKNEETNNYEIGKVTEVITQDRPRISRISIAVMVDERLVVQGDGKAVWTARPAPELARITDLVKSVVGFDARRGDVVTVTSMRFDEHKEEEPNGGKFFGYLTKDEAILNVSRYIVAAIFVFSILYFFVRPLVLNKNGADIKYSSKTLRVADESGIASAQESRASILTDQVLQPGAQAMVPFVESRVALANRNVTDDLISMRGIDGRVRISSIQSVVDLIETQPEDSLAVIRSWLASEGDG